MNLPKKLTLKEIPDGYLSQNYPLTVGREYKVHGQMGSCLIIETNIRGQTASIHFSRFTMPVNKINIIEFN